MITVKTKAEIARMRDAGRIAAIARATAGEYIKEGVTTRYIDSKVKAVIRSHGAHPSFLGYGGFPASACISVNEEVIHGIPSDRELKNGDIVKEKFRKFTVTKKPERILGIVARFSNLYVRHKKFVFFFL